MWITKNIEEHEYTITNIWNIKKCGTSIVLLIFYVELKPEKNNKDIYEIRPFLTDIVKFELISIAISKTRNPTMY